MLHEEGKFPYKIQLVQELQPNDLEYAMQSQDLANGDLHFLKNLIMFDEAHFHLNGFINKQNCRIWESENPHATAQRQLHPQKYTVWCGVLADEVIEPYFFKNEGENVTVTGARYCQMLEDFVQPWVQNKPPMWFQQDGAIAHTAQETLNLLQDIFGN